MLLLTQELSTLHSLSMLKNNSVFPIQGDPPYRRNGVWISGSLLALKLTPEVYDLVPHLLCDRHKQKSKNAKLAQGARTIC